MAENRSSDDGAHDATAAAGESDRAGDRLVAPFVGLLAG